MVLACALPAPAQSSVQTFPVGASPVVRIQARSADLTIRTWNRSQVQISSAQAVQARTFGPLAVQRAIPSGDIPIFSTTSQSPNGPVSLTSEDFPVDGIAGSPHDGVIIFGGDAGQTMTVTVPAGTALVIAGVGAGAIHANDLHTALVALVHNGIVQVGNSSGEAFLEAARGGIVVRNSGFDRIRARSAVGSIFLQNCNVRQIEASTVYGHIAFDNGTFAPGLARFETQHGNIALGVASGGLQVGAHAGGGRVIGAFNPGGGSVNGTGSDAQAQINGGGGPLVTAITNQGSVVLYNGSMRANQRINQWMPHPRQAPRMFAPKARTCAGRRCRV